MRWGRIGIGLLLVVVAIRGAMQLGQFLGGGAVVPPAAAVPPPPDWLLPAIQQKHSGEMVHLVTAFPPIEFEGRQTVRCYYEVFEGEGSWRQECKDFVREPTGEVQALELGPDPQP